MSNYNKVPEINDLYVIENKIFKDERGYFGEIFNAEEFFQNTEIKFLPVQLNESCSTKGVIRGLHLQKGEYAQAKLVRCIKGKIMDVVMDIRKESSSFGKIFKIILEENSGKCLFVPKGFAHGFIAFENNSVIQYLVDAPYNKESESGIKFPENIIKEIKNNLDFDIIMSDKDKKWLTFEETFNL